MALPERWGLPERLAHLVRPEHLRMVQPEHRGHSERLVSLPQLGRIRRPPSLGLE